MLHLVTKFELRDVIIQRTVIVSLITDRRCQLNKD